MSVTTDASRGRLIIPALGRLYASLHALAFLPTLGGGDITAKVSRNLLP